MLEGTHSTGSPSSGRTFVIFGVQLTQLVCVTSKEIQLRVKRIHLIERHLFALYLYINILLHFMGVIL